MIYLKIIIFFLRSKGCRYILYRIIRIKYYIYKVFNYSDLIILLAKFEDIRKNTVYTNMLYKERYHIVEIIIL